MEKESNNKNYILAGYRTMLGKTQEEFANILEISKQSYNQKELGKVSFNDREKRIIKNYLDKSFPEITYETLFFK